jgi:ABC-type bacteriocin/lantibiotic exporter with double-glycine peptidase domain
MPLLGYRQTRSYSCGFATALMVLRTFERPVEARELFESLRTGRSGTRQTAIVTELRRRGLRANTRYDLDFAGLARAIDAGKLVVAYLGDAEHWLVVYGYGRGPERVFVADPRPGEACEHPWDRYGARLGGFGIVCSRPEPSRAPEAPAR